jgi:hypothetical protein
MTHHLSENVLSESKDDEDAAQNDVKARPRLASVPLDTPMDVRVGTQAKSLKRL